MQAQQQADDGGFSGAAGADDADALAGGDGEVEVAVGGAAAALVGEADFFERDAGGQVVDLGGARGRGGGGDRGVEKGVDAVGGGLADHALVQDGAQVAQRTKNF